jgi:hypothetical protein
MQYFEQVHRGIRAPGRALAPAICAVALCTAALILAAWPTMAEATNYQIVISNETNHRIKIFYVQYKFEGSSWRGFYNQSVGIPKDERWGRDKALAGGGTDDIIFKVKWICRTFNNSNNTVTSGTRKNRTVIHLYKCGYPGKAEAYYYNTP